MQFSVLASIALILGTAKNAQFVGTKPPLTWETLTVTWGPVPVPGRYFDKLPLTINAAKEAGWSSISNSCYNEASEGKFSGFRFIMDLDTSLTVIYNVNGVISGIQMNPKVRQLSQRGNDYKFNQVSMFQEDTIRTDEVYTLTAYFSDPSTICNPVTARTEMDIKKSGIGNGLYFQDGNISTRNFEVSKNRQVALKTGWNNNRCFPGMGWHTWYKSKEWVSTNCTVVRLVFLLFNRNQDLIGFGFNVVGTANSLTNRYEHPPALAVRTIMGNPPQCIIDKQKKVGLTTMHVFFVDYWAIPKLGCVNLF